MLGLCSVIDSEIPENFVLAEWLDPSFNVKVADQMNDTPNAGVFGEYFVERDGERPQGDKLDIVTRWIYCQTI
jgi:hypothetical protein